MSAERLHGSAAALRGGIVFFRVKNHIHNLRVVQMVTASYFRIHAETCVRLARAVKDERIAVQLVAMAEDFTAKAAELDAEERCRRVSLI
jgi:hypothetical protein